MPKQFTLGQVLNVTTGRIITNMDDIYDLLEFMTDSSLMTPCLPSAANKCEPFIFKQFPIFNSPEMQFAHGELIEMFRRTEEFLRPALIIGWLSKLECGKYGVTFPATFTLKSIKEHNES